MGIEGYFQVLVLQVEGPALTAELELRHCVPLVRQLPLDFGLDGAVILPPWLLLCHVPSYGVSSRLSEQTVVHKSHMQTAFPRYVSEYVLSSGRNEKSNADRCDTGRASALCGSANAG